MLSNRINTLEFSAIRKLLPIANEAIRKGKNILRMNAGVPDTDTPNVFFEAISKFDENRLAYAPSNGLPELKNAISNHFKTYNLNYSEDEIFVTVGATEAINFSLLCLTDIGDSILTTNPYYSNYETFFNLAEINLDVFQTSIENNYDFPSKEEIEKSIHSKTKALLMCNPSNPTGKVMTKKEVEMICEIAIKHNLYIIADEIYRDFVYDNKEFISFGNYLEVADRLIIVDSVSKRYSACGARMGAVLVKNKELREKIEKLCSARISAPLLEQLGTVALYKTDKSYIESVTKEYEQRRDLAFNLVSKIPGVSSNYPQGAFYMILKLPVDDTEKFATWLLSDFEYEGETILLTPAGGFYKDDKQGKDEIRLVFALSQEKIERGIQLLEKGLEAYLRL